MVDELLKQDFDFTRDEEMVTEPDLLQYPRTKRRRGALAATHQYDLLVLKRTSQTKRQGRQRAKEAQPPKDPGGRRTRKRGTSFPSGITTLPAA